MVQACGCVLAALGQRELSVARSSVLTSGADPLDVANHMPLRAKYYRDANAEIIQKYFADQFNLDRGGSIEALARNNIKLVLVRTPRLIQGLDNSALLDRLRDFGGWVLYRVRADAQMSVPHPPTAPALR